MRTVPSMSALGRLALAAVLLSAAGAQAQQVVNLTAAPTSTALPDGTAVPMWGYSCGTAQSGSLATCASLNPAAGTAWSPVVITVPAGQDLQILLTNNLPLPPGASAGIPTSLVILGQVGGGLGSPTYAASPGHAPYPNTWFTAGTTSGATFNPPAQGNRVQSIGTEVPQGATIALTWKAPRPGTYLLESGTHSSIQVPMGLYGMVVVTQAPAASGATTTTPATELSPGCAYPPAGTPGAACPAAVTYDAEVDLLMSEIDPVQNAAVQAAVQTAGFQETSTLELGTSAQGTLAGVTCSGGAAACYPPAVNYTPTYFLFNGRSFDRSNASASLFPAYPTVLNTAGAKVLVRFANAGLRMHVPALVNSLTGDPAAATTIPLVPGMTLLAEDGNPVPPTAPRVQSSVFLPAGKTFDVLYTQPSAVSGAIAPSGITPVFDRELSLSANAVNRDAGMLGYISVGGATLAAGAGSTPATVQANPDTYNAVIAGKTLTVSDPSRGVLANDVNVFGARVIVPPTQGTLALNANGTFTYAAFTTFAGSDSFVYCGNGAVLGSPACANVTLGSAQTELSSNIHTSAKNYTATVLSGLTIHAPGVLQGDSDDAGYPLSVANTSAAAPATVPLLSAGSGASVGNLVTLFPDGGFTVSGVAAPGTYTFSYVAQNAQGTQSAATQVSVVFPAASNLVVTVLDPVTNATIGDYRWILEEDQTFYVDPNCTTNPLDTTKCTTVTPQGAPFGFGTNFHTSHMPVVATGCTGPLSCESGQTLLGQAAVCDIGNGACRTTASQQTPLLPSQVNLDPTKRYYLSVLPGDASNPFATNFQLAPSCVVSNGAIVPSPGCGHGMGGVAIPAPCLPKTIQPGCSTAFAPVTVLTQPSPYPTGKLSVHVFEDDFPLDGIFSPGGGVDVLAPNEPGLGGFSIVLLDAGGGPGDATGQVTYDMFNQPLSNSLAGTLDPVTGQDACPISPVLSQSSVTTGSSAQAGVVGMIVTCPKYESDGRTLSPLAGMAVIANLPPARYSVVANPGADRIAAGEEWLQTNTLDGQKGHDAFVRIGEPAYFQEYGPSGFHVDIGFANPAIINARRHNAQGTGMCDPAGSAGGTGGTQVVPGGGALLCNNTIKGHVTSSRLSRAPDQRIYGSRTRQSLAFTQCYISLGDPDGFDFAFAKCDANGNFEFDNIPAGNWKITTFDQWNDQIIDGITQAVALNCGSVTASGPCNPAGAGAVLDMGEIATHQWQANIYTRTFLDLNGNGISDKDANGNDTEPGLPLENVNNRWRDGSFSNYNTTDLNGYANYNEVFPLFNWYVFDSYTTRYKTTGVHVVMDAGGPVDVAPAQAGTLCNQGPVDPVSGNSANGDRACGASSIAANMANTYDLNPLPADLALPGALYCGFTAGPNGLVPGADCAGKSMNPALSNRVTPIAGGWSGTSDTTSCAANTVNGTPLGVKNCTPLSTGRIDPPYYFSSYGWQGFIGQNQWLEYGKKPYVPGETGGIRGFVVYASTRPYDDPQLLLQNQWEPLIPRVTINLYQEGLAADGVTPTLVLVDTTTTTSFDDWAQGFRTDPATGQRILAADGTSAVPNVSCPGQTAGDNLFYALANQPTYLDWYNNVLHNPTGTPGTAAKLPYNSQFKCYDGMHNWNQLQPVPYDGLYVFPSVTGIDPKTGRPSGTNCRACVTDVDADDAFRYGGSATAQPYVNGVSPGTPVLPPGKYVVEVVVPPGYELVKEEDKNILIGDAFIAPAQVQFPGLGGNIFILPDQASLSAEANLNNAQNPTLNLGRNVGIVSHEGDTKQIESYWPCVGALRTVPDFLSLFPTSKQISPFAGAQRNLCDRKEVILTDQSSAQAKFFLFTSTHIAAHFTGVILDDFTGEFDPFSPQWGEKFAPAYIPVSVKDWAGNETNRVYSDAFGLYNGLNYSTWEVNPPNPTGYSPTMMVMCMNDAGLQTISPWWSPSSAGKVAGLPDPFFQPGYSTFCYELAFMPGQTGYFDTPVVPVASFSEGYNHPDCAYPDATPAIKEVDGDGIGPWIAASGEDHRLRITALGDVQVENYGYSGPAATQLPFNQQKITRHYGFGTARGRAVLITPDGTSYPLEDVSWSDGVITGTVPDWTCNTSATSPNCPMQQQAYFAQWNGASQGSVAPSPIRSAQLVITAANGRSTVDSVTVWIGGKAPVHVDATGSIQAAIDAAAPGDLIIVDPTCTASAAGSNIALASCTSALPPGSTLSRSLVSHNEMVQMWKPVRLQGVGAASSIIDANTQPAGRLLDPWRLRINCLMGLTPQGRPRDPSDMGCAAGWAFASGGAPFPEMIADRLPLEAILGWDAALNGNLAEQLIEPSLLGAYEGAAITVLSKGVLIPSTASVNEAFGATVGANAGGAPAAFPDNTRLLSPADCASVDTAGVPLYPTLFQCNPSSIDGLGIRNSSQGGGGIFVHAYGHNLQVANNRIYNNTGTNGGGITLGLGEVVGPQLAGSAPPPSEFPGTCLALDANFQTSPPSPAGMSLPHCYNLNLNVHHNAITLNSSLGDELFSSTPSGAGGISINNGDDNYRVANNWVCGNLNVGDGGGVSHIGFSNDGRIVNNAILFNESTNPSITTNGGGLLLMGSPDADPTTCGVSTDIDCVPPPSTISPSDGVGRNVVVNANLILGNAASSGSGGGLRLQHVNGTDVVNMPAGATVCPSSASCAWNSATVTNNIIANNVAGWDGAGVSLQDTLVATIANNTIVGNDSTASSGALLTALFAPLASAASSQSGGVTGGGQTNINCGSGNGQSCPQVAGLVVATNSPVLMANLRTAVDAQQMSCPPGHGVPLVPTAGPTGFTVPSCFYYSVPVLANDVIWDNHSYYIGVGGPGTGQQNKQNVVTLFNAFTGTTPASQPASPSFAGSPNGGRTVTGGTGACVGSPSLWEVGVRGDTTPASHAVYADSDTVFTLTGSQALTMTLSPTYSDLSDGLTDYGPAATTHNVAGDPAFVSFYCNGSRTPPENGGQGWLVPPGTIESNGLPNPVFSLTPSAVVDEGNNWVNLRWGPLSLVNPLTGTALGDWNLASASSAAYNVGLDTSAALPTTTADYFGRTRPAAGRPAGSSGWDLGAVEYSAGSVSNLTVSCGGTAITVPCAGLNFGTQAGTRGTELFLTLANAAGGGVADLYPFDITPPFARSTTRPGSCRVTLQPGATCTIGVVLTATATGTYNGTAAINASSPVIGSPVPLSGTVDVRPVLASISPASGERGTSVVVTLTGTNFTDATAVTVGGGGAVTVAPGSFTVLSNTTITATFVIAAGAPIGAHSVTVHSPVGNSRLAGGFTVTGATVRFSAPSPALDGGGTGTKTGTVTVTNTGTGPFTLTAAPSIAKTSGGGGSGAFSIVGAGTTCASGFALQPAGSASNVACTIEVQYSGATSSRNATGTVTLTGVGAQSATITDAVPAN